MTIKLVVVTEIRCPGKAGYALPGHRSVIHALFKIPSDYDDMFPEHIIAVIMDFSFPIRAAHSSLTDNRLAKSASVISGSSSPLSSSQSLAVSVSSEAAKAHSHTSLAISKAAQALGHPA